MKIVEIIKGEILTYVNAGYPSCSVCGRIFFREEELFCEECKRKLEWNEENCCIKCGRALEEGARSVLCSICEEDEMAFSNGLSLFVYDKYSKLVVGRIKEKNRKELAIRLGGVIASRMKEVIFCDCLDLIIPIPLHIEKLKKRGYNQAFMLAKGIGDNLNIEVIEDVLIKAKQTREQKTLSREEREANLIDSFEVKNKDRIEGKTVLIVDDVFTTGRTINIASKLLMESGAKEVYIASLASTRDRG